MGCSTLLKQVATKDSDTARMVQVEQSLPAEEDPRAKWEWELSGQLRYSCRRTPSGFGGSQAFSSLVP